MQREAHAAGEDGDRLIAAFLRANPGWLAAHPELYAVLLPPRRLHGETVADHMAAMLDQARRHAADAAAGRRAAESFAQRVQEAVLALMRAPDPAWCLDHELPGLLRVESVRVSTRPGLVEASLGQRCAVLRDCGPDRALHGETAPLINREALVRVPLSAVPALLALGARDPAELDGASTPVLAFLGQALAAAIDRA